MRQIIEQLVVFEARRRLNVGAALPVTALAVTSQVQDGTALLRKIIAKTGHSPLPDQPKLLRATGLAAGISSSDLLL